MLYMIRLKLPRICPVSLFSVILDLSLFCNHRNTEGTGTTFPCGVHPRIYVELMLINV